MIATIKRFAFRLLVVTMVPVILYEGSGLYLKYKGWCVGDVCGKWECPDGDGIGIVGEGYLACEDFDEYVETRDPRLLY